MTSIMVTTAVALAMCSTVFAAPTVAAAQAAPATPTAPAPQAGPPSHVHAVPAAGATPSTQGLSDLDAMTFGCPKAALNAAAREASTVRSQGTYQFSYFKIINDSHHAAYEVHFKSNYPGEADLNYCVALYCQQGWDPKTTKASVTLMGSKRGIKGGAAQESHCAVKQAPVKRRVKR
jgi:hypothetical protein